MEMLLGARAHREGAQSTQHIERPRHTAAFFFCVAHLLLLRATAAAAGRLLLPLATVRVLMERASCMVVRLRDAEVAENAESKKHC